VRRLRTDSGRSGIIHLEPVVGSAKPETIFEYGSGRVNIHDYRWITSMEGVVNLLYSVSPDFTDTTVYPVLTSADAASQTARGVREEVLQSTLTDNALRQALLDEHIAVRAEPRTIFEIKPAHDDGTGRVPAPFEEYDVGDTITTRIREANGNIILTGDVRVWGFEVDLSEEGLEGVTLTLIPT
jgi:hypothetical protein